MGKRLNSILWIEHPDGRLELDFGWAILAVCCIVGLGVFTLTAAGAMKPGPSPSAWAWFGSFTTLAFIAGAAISRARLIASSNTPGAVAQGIAAAPAWEPDMRRDDERGEYTEREEVS